jgi:alkanesulfonate monooxygenase SsuD/methylene tetrahydromethanopterin reductase-like flavin-dependent oxidoreductase (luciferase family)
MIIRYADDQRAIGLSVGIERKARTMTTTHRVTFGVKTSQANTTYEDVLKIWREADQVPAFEHAWLWDHLVPLRGDVRGPALEAWTLLAALAAQTERLRLGVIVTSNRLRPPAVLAKMAATVDRISNGRLVFGIGAGGSAVRDPAGLELVHRELDAYGIPVVPTGVAIDALDEACVIAKRMWTETEPFDFDGRHYQLSGAVCEPKPVQPGGPPIMIGAGGHRSLRVVARHADIWNCPTRGDVGMVRDLGRILDDHCAEIGRDPAEIERSVQLLVAAAPSAVAPAAGLPHIADAATTRDLALELIDAGVTHIVLAPVAATTDRPIQWLADEIVEPIRQVLGR